MRTNFYQPMFLFIVFLPCLLLFKPVPDKTHPAYFVEEKPLDHPRDTIQLFEIKDGKEKPCFMNFDLKSDNLAYFLRDTVVMRLNAGWFGGYAFRIKLTDKEYTSWVSNYDCTWSEFLDIKEQRLELEDFELVHQGKLKGHYYCKAKHKNKYTSDVDTVVIRGYFELDLIDAATIPY